MLKRNLTVLLLSVCLFVGVGHAFAQPLFTETPTAEVTPEPTPAPVENPVDATLVLPYVGAMAVIAVIGLIVLGGAGFLFLFRSSPAARFIGGTVVPPLGDAGVAFYENWAKNTKEPFDDALAVQLRAEWEAFKKQLLSDVSVQVASKVGTELNKQLPAAVSEEVSAQVASK
jgi:hypothetical protein